MTLGDYLREQSAKAWAPGVSDCCTLPGDWALTWSRGDPMAEWRGRYRSDAQGLRFIHAAGGLVTLWARGLASIGVKTVGETQAGDVAVVLALSDFGPEPVGAIWTGDRWALRAPRGLIFAPAQVLSCWGPR